MADTDPIQPFGTSLQDVLDLLPQATFPETVNPGQRAVTKAMVGGYIGEVGRRVDLRLVDRARLVKAEHLAAVVAAAKDLVANGAASYAQAARFPEQAGANRDGYADLLWRRFTTGLDELAAQVAAWLVDADEVAPQTNDSPGWSFPAPTITDRFLP